MTLAIFDLDDTLLNGDSASLFCQFLVDQQLASAAMLQQDQAFNTQYLAGTYSITAYIRFMLAPISHLSQAEITALMAGFVRDYIVPNIYPQAYELLVLQRAQNKRILLVSATVEFIVTAVAQHLKIDDVLAIELESQTIKNNNSLGFSGDISGVPSFREGKVTRLLAWLEQTGEGLEQASFYSDSNNDLALLQLVDHPIAVNPELLLRQHAIAQGWSIIDWRNG